MLSKLPEVYKIPTFHGPSEPRVFDDNYLLMFKPSPKGKPWVDTEEGILELKSRWDIPKLYKRKYNWTYSRLREWECIFQFFTAEELFRLRMLGHLQFGAYKLFWIPNTCKMRLEMGGGPQSSRFLINTAHWCHANYLAESLENLKIIVEKLLILNKIIPINITSPASTTKDFILSVGGNNFSIYNELPLEGTKFLHTCYIGPRMESRYLGTVEHAETMDLKRAYLRALGKCPSMDQAHVLKVTRGGPFSPDAHPGSGYEIMVDVPKSYDRFAPIPHKWQGKIPYPQGKFGPIRVSKPYIDLLNERGDISYTILDSYQIILYGKPHYPYKNLAQVLESFQNEYQDYFYPINLKALHYPIQGHMIHIHRNMELSDGHIWYETGQDYNPAYACAIQGMVACELWKMSQDTNTEQIRVDALSGYKLPENPNFTKESQGLMTTYTPGLKDKPGSSVYRDLIHAFRDYPEIRIKIPWRLGLGESWAKPSRIGTLTTVVQHLPPSRGNRDNGHPLGIKRIGGLLDTRIEIPIPEIPAGAEPADNKEVPYWMDDYLHLFPQIQT